jgi:peptidoglycan-N-acetylglucosamine deacetylase
MIFFYIRKSKLKKVFTALTILLSSVLMMTIVDYGKSGVFSNAGRKLPIYSVDTKEKKVAITFDVSWDKDNTDKILALLDKYNVKATFFLVGTWIDQYPDKLKAMYDKGHEIGNHTNRHPDMNSITREKLINEIELADSKIRKITGQGTTLFRSPSGAYNDLVIETVENMKRYCIQWDVDSVDWREEGADIEYNRVIKKTSPGSIILFHNEAKYTPENLPRIIEYLKKEGYKFEKVSELIYKENYYINYSGKQIYNKNN